MVDRILGRLVFPCGATQDLTQLPAQSVKSGEEVITMVANRNDPTVNYITQCMKEGCLSFNDKDPGYKCKGKILKLQSNKKTDMVKKNFMDLTWFVFCPAVINLAEQSLEESVKNLNKIIGKRVVPNPPANKPKIGPGYQPEVDYDDSKTPPPPPKGGSGESNSGK